MLKRTLFTVLSKSCQLVVHTRGRKYSYKSRVWNYPENHILCSGTSPYACASRPNNGMLPLKPGGKAYVFILIFCYLIIFFCHPSLDISGSGYGKSNTLVWNGVFVPGSMLHTSTRITGVVDYEHPLFPSGILEGAKRDRAWKSPHARKVRCCGERKTWEIGLCL